jgi:glycosyltransferase involved in cell wall biosynthesis
VTVPELSVVCVAGQQRRRVARCLDALAAQSAVDRIEVVVVDVSGKDNPIPLPVSLVPANVIRLPASTSLGGARATGARAAHGAAIAFLLDHGYPSPEWAEALIDAYSGPWTAVGYAFDLANPRARAARTAMLAQFLPWLSPAIRGATTALPGNMVSYRASFLHSLDGDLEQLLEIDLLLHQRIAASGQAMAIEPGAVVRHECFESLTEVALANHIYSEMLAAQRARADDWPLWRRVAYGLGSPLGVTAVRLARTVAAARRARRLVALALALPGVVGIAVLAAFGEARGYLRPDRELRTRFLWRELNAPRASG